MTIKKTALIVFAVAAVVILAIYYFQSTAQRTNAGPSTETTASVEKPKTAQGGSQSPDTVDQANGFSQPSPDADQATELATPLQYKKQTITAPAMPKPDMQKPATVAQAFLTIYNSRSSDTDVSWQETVKPWLTPDLAEKLPTVPNGSLTGKAPAAVTAVKVGDQVKDWGIDTPLRWSHNMQVTMATQDQGTYTINYRVQAQLTDQGWLVNTAKLDTWQRVGK